MLTWETKTASVCDVLPAGIGTNQDLPVYGRYKREHESCWSHRIYSVHLQHRDALLKVTQILREIYFSFDQGGNKL